MLNLLFVLKCRCAMGSHVLVNSCICHGFFVSFFQLENKCVLEWFGLEETLKIISFQLPCHVAGILSGRPGCSKPQPAWP